jgi:hypothetical protein
MSYIRTRTAALALLLFGSACGGSGAKLHASALEVVHTALDQAGHAVDEGCALAVERAETLERAEVIGATCVRTAATQRGLVASWALWAKAALVRMAGGDFDMTTALTFARALKTAYVDMAATLATVGVSIPPVPAILTRLLGDEAGIPPLGEGGAR